MPKRMETVPAFVLVTARSSLPLPLKSAIATDVGAIPAG